MQKNNIKGFAVPLLVGAIATAGALAVVVGGGTQMVVKLVKESTTKDTSNIYLKLSAFALTADASDSDGDGFHEAPVMAANADGTGVCAGGALVATSTTACYIPSTSSSPKGDAWGSNIKYCSFDNGTTNTSAGRITGANPATGASITFALVSAGPNKAYDTTCALAAAGTTSGDDVVYRFSGLQITQGVSGTQYWGDPVSNSAALASLDPAQQKDGEARVQKDTGQVHRFDAGTSTWKPTNGVTAINGTGVGIGMAVLPAATLHVDKGAAGEALRIGGTGDQSISFGGGPSIASSGNAVDMVLNASGQANQLTLKNSGRILAAGATDNAVGTLQVKGGLALQSAAGADAIRLLPEGLSYLNTGNPLLINTGAAIDGAVALQINGGATSNGTIKAAYLLPTTTVTLGDACATTGAIAQSATGQALSCVSGTWLASGFWNLNAGGDQYNTNSSGAMLINSAVNDGTGAKLQVSGDTSLAGNLRINGAARRILADLSNATDANRLLFQSSTVNGDSYVGVIPNGTATTSAFVAYNNANPAAGNAAILRATTAAVELSSTGVLPITINPGGTTILSATATGVTINGTLYNSYKGANSTGRNIWIGGGGQLSYATDGTVPGEGSNNVALGVSAMTANTTGYANVAVGYSALTANTTGYSNVGVGYSTLMSNTTGYDNVAVGRNALAFNTTGYYNTAVGFGGLFSNTTGLSNTAVGMQVLFFNTTGDNNTAIGMRSLMYNTTGYQNTAVGVNALISNTTGFYNTAGGVNALSSNTTGSYNVAQGVNALYSNTTGSYNVASGMGALFSNTTANHNTAVGYTALYSNTTGGNNTATGYTSLYFNTTGVNNTAYGVNALYSNVTGDNNTAAGVSSLYSNTTGYNNTANGLLALYLNTTGYNNTASGMSALYSNTTGYGNTASGMNALFSNTTGLYNVAVGQNALYSNDTGNSNVAVGLQALRYNTSGGYNTAIGREALSSNTTGANNTASGYASLFSNTTGYSNTANGITSLYLNTTGYNNTASGMAALYSNTTGRDNTASGRGSLFSNTTGYNNTADGVSALYSNTTGYQNTAIGVSSLYANTIGYSNTSVGIEALSSNIDGYQNTAIGGHALMSNNTGYSNTSVGNQSLQLNTTGNRNTAIGTQALRSNTTGFYNTASGYQSLYSNTTGSQNTASGMNALYSNTTGTYNTAHGLNALYSNTTANYNTAIGADALQFNTTGFSNTATGLNALKSNTTGYQNTANGMEALYSNTTGVNNTANGMNALYSNTTGTYNTAIGMQSLNYNTTGYYNTASGARALQFNTAGYQNTASGMDALYSNTTGYNNTANGLVALYSNTTGYFNTASGLGASYSNTIGAQNTAYGVSALYYNTTGSDNTAIGFNGLVNLTTGSGNIGIGGMNASGVYSPVVNITTQNNLISMGSTSVTTAYVQVPWTVVSDARDKMNFGTIPHGLDFVRKLKPLSYQFKMSRNNSTPNGRVRYGFLAQDILALEGSNGVIIDNTDANKLRFNEADLIPVLVNGIQELDRNLETTRSKVDKAISDSNDWAGNVIPANKGGTGLVTAPGVGQILIGNGTGYTLSRLDGVANQISVTHDADGTHFALANDVRVHGKLFASSLSLLADAQSITNTTTINGALAKVAALKGVYGDINGRRQLLFVAQDVETVFPELVDTNPDGLKTIGYAGVLPVLVEAVKELHAKVGPLYPLAEKLSVLADGKNTIRIDAPVLVTGGFTAKTVTAEKVIADEVQGKTRVFSDAIERQIVGGGYADILDIPDQGAIVLNVSSPDGRSHLSASIINTGNTLKIASNMKDGFDLQAVGTQVRLVNTDAQTKNAKASWVRTQ